MLESPKYKYRSGMDSECSESTRCYPVLGSGRGKEEDTVTYMVGVVGWDGP